MSDQEHGSDLERALAAIASVDLALGSDAERDARAQRVRNDRLDRMAAPAPEPIQRPADRFGDAATTAQIAARVTAPQAGADWNAWFAKSFENRLPDVWRVMGEALGQAIGEARSEIEAEAAAKIEGIKVELVRAVGEALARQRHETEREFALLRGEIARLKGFGDDRT